MKYLLKNAVDYIADVDLNNDSKMSFKEYEDSHFVPGKRTIAELRKYWTEYEYIVPACTISFLLLLMPVYYSKCCHLIRRNK